MVLRDNISHVLALLAPFLLILPLIIVAAIEMRRYQSAEAEITTEMDRFDKLRSFSLYKRNSSTSTGKDSSEYNSSWYLPGETPAIMTAALQERLRELANASDVQVSQTSQTTSNEDGNMPFVGAHLEATGLALDIYRLLASVEQSKPLLLIDNLQLTADVGNETDLQAEPIVHLSIDVRGATVPAKPVK